SWTLRPIVVSSSRMGVLSFTFPKTTVAEAAASATATCRSCLRVRGTATGRLRGLQLVRDVVEDRLHLRAGRRDRAEGDERDERHQEGVLEQVLPGVVLREHAETVDQAGHHISSRASIRRATPCVRNAITPFLHDRATHVKGATAVPQGFPCVREDA